MNKLLFLFFALFSLSQAEYKDLGEELCGTAEQDVSVEILTPKVEQALWLKKDKKTRLKIQIFADSLQSHTPVFLTDIDWNATAHFEKGKIVYFSKTAIRMVHGEYPGVQNELGVLGEKYNLAIQNFLKKTSFAKVLPKYSGEFIIAIRANAARCG